MTGGATLAAAAVVSAGTGLYEASQAGKTSGMARGEAGTVFGEQQYYAGLLQQYMQDPASVITKLPGYQFTLQQGLDATRAADASSVGVGASPSGKQLTDLTTFAEGTAMQYGNIYEQQLAQLSGLTAASSPAQLTQAATGAQAQTTSTLSGALNALGFFGALSAGGGGSIFGGGGIPTTPAMDAGAMALGGSPTMTMPNAPGYVFNTPGVN